MKKITEQEANELLKFPPDKIGLFCEFGVVNCNAPFIVVMTENNEYFLATPDEFDRSEDGIFWALKSENKDKRLPNIEEVFTMMTGDEYLEKHKDKLN